MNVVLTLIQPDPSLKADVSSMLFSFKKRPAAKAIAEHCTLLTSLTIGEFNGIGEGGAKQTSVPFCHLCPAVE